MQLDMQ